MGRSGLDADPTEAYPSLVVPINNRLDVLRRCILYSHGFHSFRFHVLGSWLTLDSSCTVVRTNNVVKNRGNRSVPIDSAVLKKMTSPRSVRLLSTDGSTTRPIHCVYFNLRRRREHTTFARSLYWSYQLFKRTHDAA